MKTTMSRCAAIFGATILMGALGTAGAEAPRRDALVGEKLDSGLGEMPRWGSVVGQKVDSGLGELPHYRHWSDKSGRAPMVASQQLAQADSARK